MPFHLTVTTASSPGAVAIIQLRGHNIARVVSNVTGQSDWPLRRLQLVRFGDDDAGLAVCFRDDWAQLMPHGGPRVVRRLVDVLTAQGGIYESQPPARQMYPEAASDLEADMLAALARAASPAAIDLLLAQPAAWRAWLKRQGIEGSWVQWTEESTDHGTEGKRPQAWRHEGTEGSQDSGLRMPDAGLRTKLAELATGHSKLETLLSPPSVVVVGRPNVGKSTLTNRMLGRAVSLVADLPGTTRDWVGGLAELIGAPARWGGASRRGEAPPCRDDAEPAPDAVASGAIAVRWLDTPGLRPSDDPLEQQAIALAAQVVRQADVLLAMRDHAIDWPAAGDLPRVPDVWVMNKCDAADAPACHGDGSSAASPLPISAKTGEGVASLEQAIINRLGLSQLDARQPWVFSATLRQLLGRGDLSALAAYVGA
jgi:small GTP-binding protein